MLDTVGAPRPACMDVARTPRRACAWLVASAAALAGCYPDVIDPGAYAPDELDAALDVSSFGPPPASGADVPDAGSPPVSPASDGSAGGQMSMSAKPTGPCDLTGRWLVTLRTVTDALGTSQAAHEWYYYELTQSGTQLTVSKGLACGKDARALSAASGNADFPKTWPAMMANIVVTGRKGTSAPASAGCQVSFDPNYEVMGATESYYTDPSHTLPTVSEQASGSTPGWEDWDQDGQPGYTLSISGLATGQIYMSDWTKYALSGAIAGSASSFDLALDWSNNQDVLGVNGPPILSSTSAAVKDSDPAQAFGTFVRLTDTQATGSDAAVCTAIRTLAPMLAAKANN